MTERDTRDDEREARIRVAVGDWTAQLIDLSRRNPLLYFRDLATGTLDLAGADASERARLLGGTKVRASRLFSDEEALRRARKNLATIRRRIRTLHEERGIDAGHLAIGLVSWPAPQKTGGPKPTRTPVLLRPLTITAKGQNAAEFELEVDETTVVNPVLLHALRRTLGVDIGGLSEIAEVSLAEQLDRVVALLRERVEAAGLALDLEDKIVAGAFAYEKLPMVEDLEASTRLLATHPLVAAMAGVGEAQHALRSRPRPPEPELNDIAPEHEHLVLDADPSQQKAIHAALDGHDLIIQGPPGTGKSQTIANLLAEATARGKKVLFVAQKRAAIDAVVNNLHARDLGDMVLDLHDPKTSKKAIAEQLQTSMDRAEQQARPDVTELHRRLADRRSQLDRRSRAMSAIRRPYGLSIVELHEHLARAGSDHDLGVLLPRRCLERLPFSELLDREDDLQRFIDLGGLRFWRGESAWSDARGVTTRANVAEVRGRLDDLSGANLQRTRDSLQRLLGETGFPRPTNIAEWRNTLGLVDAVAVTLATHGRDAFDGELEDRRAAVAPRAWRRERAVSLGYFQRRRLTRSARDRRSSPADTPTLFAELSAAVEQRNQWTARTGGHGPHAVNGADDARVRYENLRNDLAAIGAAAAVGDLERGSEPEMDDQVRRLRSDDDVLNRLPELNGYRERFEELGLGPLLDRLAASNESPAKAAAGLRYAWLVSVIRELRAEVPEYATFTAAAQDRVINEFRDADQEHIGVAAARVRRALAERQVSARDQWPEQRSVVRGEVARKRPRLSLRQLVEKAPDLLLAIRPCWAMSPLVVSQVLPASRLFDLVVFDEASQIEPGDAIAAIARGRSVVVAGDSKQLPPTAFFSTTTEGDDDDVESDDALSAFESIIDRLSKDLHPLTLSWHYRSADDRLIAYPNQAIYDDALTTFPSTALESPVRHVEVAGPTPPGTKGLSPAEVDRVVDLALTHARERPNESLGVITLGVPAVERVRRRLDEALEKQPDLSGFFEEESSVGHGFFVKSLESVQGDERDAIILTVGGSRSASGALSHHFGPINHAGGERRLNVAVTRAKNSMTVVSSFGHQDLDEHKLRGAGLQFLRGYLRFAAEQSASRESTPATAGSALEGTIAERLRAAGIRVHQQYGASTSRIPIAAEDVTRPGRLLLAVEVDGADYHGGVRSVRARDRLRPRQLERMGWHHRRVWASEWHQDPDRQITELVTTLASASSDPHEPDSVSSETRVPGRKAVTNGDHGRPAERDGPRPPGLTPGLAIPEYSHASLVRLARWIDSDGLLRDEEQMIDVMKDELKFQRRGKNIVAAFERAIRDARRPGRS